MKITPREKALGTDLYDTSIEISTLRRYMLYHLKWGNSMLPNDFWERVFDGLERAVVCTDIAECFPTQSERCPEYLKKPS